MKLRSDRNGSSRIVLTFFLAGLFFGSALLFWTPENTGEVTYPEEYTHRPLLEWFTGLGCPPCINGAHPAMEEVMEEQDNISGEPFNMVVFHNNLSGSQRDDLTTEKSLERFDYYKDDLSGEGIPNMIFDGGFNELNPQDPDEIWEEINAAGDRNVKKATLWVRFELRGDSLKFYVKANNIDNSQIQGSLYVFVIENDVLAYSSVADDNITSELVFRDYGIEGKSISIDAGGWYNESGEWDIDPNATVPIDPEELSVVVALYDRGDQASVKLPPSLDPSNNYKKPTPRCIQSATPESTEHDGGYPVDPSKITLSSISHIPKEPTPDDEVTISAIIVSTYPLVSATLSYSVGGTDFTPFEMTNSGDNYSAVIGPFKAGDTVKYEISAEDEKGVTEASSEKTFEVKEKPADDDDDDDDNDDIGDDDDNDDDPDGSLTISNIRMDPEVPYKGADVRIFATVESDHKIDSVELLYWEEGDNPSFKDMRKSGGEYYANIGRFDDGVKLFYEITATDDSGNEETSEEISISIVSGGEDTEPADEETPGFGVVGVLFVLVVIVTATVYMRRR